MQIISHSLGWLNISAAAGWLTGTIAGEIVAMQTPLEPVSAWWQHSAVISALVVAIFMLIGKLIDQHYKNKEKKQNRGDALQAQEIRFWKEQLTMKQVSEFEARQRAHRFGNETHRLSLHIFMLHALMSEAGIKIPEFYPKHYEELMKGLDEEVAKFRSSLAERLEEAIHKTER